MRFSNKRLARCLSGTAISALLAGGAMAQQEAFQLDPIYLEARDPYSDAADRATSMYVSGLELERARSGDMKDVFAGIASVSVGGALPLTQKIYVNGVDMLNLGVTIDGTAQNNRAFHHVSANAIDPGLLQRVRADATVAPADAGPYALAGSVVFETVDPVDILDEGDSFGGNVRLSYGDNGSTVQTALTVAGRAGGFSWLGYGKRANGGNYDSGAGAEILGTAADLTSYLGKLAYESDGGHRVEVSGQRLHDKELRQFRANFGGLGGVTDNLRVYDTTRSSFSIKYENTRADGLWDPEFHFGYSESDVVVPEPWDSNGLSGTWSATLKNTAHLNGDDTITAGVDWRQRFGEYTSPTFGDQFEETSQTFGIFAQARLEPAERWGVSLGGRADYQNFTGLYGDELNNIGISGNASVRYALTDTFSVRGGVSSVFGGIDIEDNYIFWTGWDYSDLQPSRANNATVGFDWEPGNFKLGGEVFYSKIANARSVDENFDFEVKGLNIGATYDWDGGFARLNASHSDVTVNGESATGFQTLDFGAPLGTVVAFEVEQETPVNGLRVGGGINAALDYAMPDGATSDLAGYTTVNLFAEYQPPRLTNLTVRAEIDNLFDVDYADRATYGADFESVTTLKEPGRTVSLVAVATF